MRPLERTTEKPDFVIRRYESRDRDVIRDLCCSTGLLGDPIDPVFSDRTLFADFLTSYYTDWEPESTWVGEVDGRVVGYLTACKRWNLNRFWSVAVLPKLCLHAAIRLLRGGYDAKDRKFLLWIIFRGWRETPAAPKQSAHFHFNADKEHRRLNMMRDLLMKMFDDLKRAGVPRVHGQMATFENKRSDKLFEYMDWKVIDKKRITKYTAFLDKDIYMTTIVREL